MMNINCTDNCIYQEPGRCTLDHVTAVDKLNLGRCTYYSKKEGKKIKPRTLR